MQMKDGDSDELMSRMFVLTSKMWSSVIWMMTQITMTNLKPLVCSAERTPCRVSARCQASGQRRLTARSCTSVKLGFTETFHVDGVQQRKSSGTTRIWEMELFWCDPPIPLLGIIV